MDAHDGFAVGGGDNAVLDGEGADAGEHVAAVGRYVHDRFVYDDLGEQVIDVAIVARRWADDCDLAGERVGAAYAIDLAIVG